jgi:hypothetical protein
VRRLLMTPGLCGERATSVKDSTSTAASPLKTGTRRPNIEGRSILMLPMPHSSRVIDSHSLRDQLMAADPMQRVMALHAIEIEAASSRTALSHEATRFTSRGIPYYALHDPHFQDWVGKAVSYWERLHAVEDKR